MKRRLAVTIIVSLWVGFPYPPNVRASTHESFEGPESSWFLAHWDCRPLRVTVHERRFSDAHTGRGCEFLQLSAGQGTAIYLAHTITPARIIQELQPSVWVKANRQGIQFIARVVFPRSTGKDGKPLTSLLYGDTTTAVDAWRQLRIENLQQKLQREVWNLRSQPGMRVDEREAYIDLVILNVYTGTGTANIWIDDLEISGSADVGTETSISVVRPAAPHREASAGPEAAPEVRGAAQQGNVLLASGRPLFVRAVEHRGETMAFLQSLGFNAVLLTSPPTDAQLAEARRSDIWLITPPPLESDTVQIRPGHQQVLAWFLGERLAARDEERINRLVHEINQAEGDQKRPILLHSSGALSRCGYEHGVMLYERALLGTSFELRDFGEWLANATWQGRRDAPFWAAIPTEVSSELRAQVERLSETPGVQVTVEPDQVRLLAYEAISRGARGLWFRSRTRLDGPDAATKLRVAMLHAINRELELVAPWAAAGTAIGEKITNNPRVRVCALETDTSRLLIVSRPVADQQFVTAPLDSEPVSFVIHGTPLSDQAYAVAPHGVEPIIAQRGGGLRVTLDAVQPISLVLLTQDPLAVNYVGRVAADIRSEYAARQLEIAQRVLEETTTTEREFNTAEPANPRTPSSLARAQTDLRQATLLLEAGDSRNSIQACGQSLNELHRVRRSYWESTVLNFPSPLSSPLCANFSTLPLHRALVGRLADATWSVNMLAAGDMEHLGHLLDSGWRQQQAEFADVNTDVRLSLEAPRSGRSSLQLRAWRTAGAQARSNGEWPITITSPPIAVREGQLVRIHGWAKVPSRFEGSWDGLMIFDSQTGPELAERVEQTQGWREFTLYRAATTSGEFKLIFAHTGIGESWIDEVSIAICDL